MDWESNLHLLNTKAITISNHPLLLYPRAIPKLTAEVAPWVDQAQGMPVIAQLIQASNNNKQR